MGTSRGEIGSINKNNNADHLLDKGKIKAAYFELLEEYEEAMDTIMGEYCSLGDGCGRVYEKINRMKENFLKLLGE